jgi:hypothetical protein
MVLKNLNNEWKLKEKKFVFIFFWEGFKKIQTFWALWPSMTKPSCYNMTRKPNRFSEMEITPPPLRSKKGRKSKSKLLQWDFVKTARKRPKLSKNGWLLHHKNVLLRQQSLPPPPHPQSSNSWSCPLLTVLQLMQHFPLSQLKIFIEKSKLSVCWNHPEKDR